ncbi:hypothetical protein [Aeropyrum pernix]|uniref:hypothetical protein n=1 Tax=Aeropyrum pernix TaxID=56636 RepID=UPI001037586A|nr:hypothetical protein [Aeropyrum pernix]
MRAFALKSAAKSLKHHNNLRYFLYGFLAYILILMFLFRGLDFRGMWAYGDLNPFTKHFIEWALYAWKEEGLGYQYVSLNYLGPLFQALLTLVFGGVIAQKIAILLPFLTSFISMYHFSKKVLNLSDILCFVSALLYSINPVTVMAFVGGFGQLMTYSLIPSIFYLFIRFLELYKIKYIMLVIAISPFLWNLYVALWVFLILSL